MTEAKSPAKLECVKFDPMSMSSSLKYRCFVVISSIAILRLAGSSCMRRWLGLAWLSLSLAAASGFAQEGGDMQAQILYAYQSEDINQLASLVQNLANQVKAGGADASLRYHLAHAEYRFGLLAQGKRAHDAAPAFADCVDQLKPILEQDVKSVEALVLQSTCYDELAKRRRLEAVLLRSKAEERLNAAFKLDPRNPRVLYSWRKTASRGRSRIRRRRSGRSPSSGNPRRFRSVFRDAERRSGLGARTGVSRARPATAKPRRHVGRAQLDREGADRCARLQGRATAMGSLVHR